jgi:hypothetical protein
MFFSSPQLANREVSIHKIEYYEWKLAAAIFRTCHWAHVPEDRSKKLLRTSIMVFL